MIYRVLKKYVKLSGRGTKGGGEYLGAEPWVIRGRQGGKRYHNFPLPF
jgi:hypothetical protein